MQKIRLKDIAEVCNVSVATVSRALNGEGDDTRQTASVIRKTAKEMGYVPNAAAVSLKTSRSYNIGILYESPLNHEYFSLLLDDLRREAASRGYDLNLITRQNGQYDDSYYEHVRRRNVDGVIVIQADFESPGIIQLASSNIPSVIIDHMYEGCNCVGSDNRSSVEQIVQYAFRKGHRNIAIITGQPGTVSRERLSGYYKACAELGIRVPEGFVREGRFHDPELCLQLIREMTAEPEKPTCVLCPDDYSCFGTLWALKAEGTEVPADISLIGYDGIAMPGMVRPRLTTYRQDTKAIARETVKLLLEVVEDPEHHRPRMVTVEGRLIEGETVGELSR